MAATPANVRWRHSRDSEIMSSDGGICDAASQSSVRLKPRYNAVPVLREMMPVLDILCLMAAAYISTALYVALRSPAIGTADLWHDYGRRALAAAVLSPLLFHARRSPKGINSGYWPAQLRSFALSFVSFVALVLGIGFATRSLDTLPRTLMALWFTLGFALLLGSRTGTALYLRRQKLCGRLSETVAVVGAGPVADRLIRHLQQTKPGSVRVVGVFDDWSGDAAAICSFRPTGTVADLVELGKRQPIDWVLITLPSTAESRLLPLVHKLKSLAVTVGLCPQNIGLSLPCNSIDYMDGGLPVTLLADRPIKRWNAVIKGLEDLLLGGLFTLMLLPVMAAIALAIKLESAGPVLFKQRRHTTNNTEFEVYKFRTMRWNPGVDCGVLRQTGHHDDRITPLGRILRRLSLDELPQFFNVLRGEMSLVGPRPHAVNMRTEQRLGHEIIDTYPHRHRVKPGITGWSQVNGSRGATDTMEQLRQRVAFDLHYVEHWSLWLDLKIILMTVWVVARGENAR
jgi:Undecaprenyl-phosphate glucose phosphotransferase